MVGHINSELGNYLKPYFYHMPLFFLIGGMLSKGQINFSLIKKTVIKYNIYIIYTYFIISLSVLFIQTQIRPAIITGIMFQNNIFETLKTAIMGNWHTSHYAVILWFVFAYGFTYLLGNYLISALKNKGYLWGSALILGYVGSEILGEIYQLNEQQIFNLSSQILTGTMFYLLGYVLKHHFIHIKYYALFAFAPVLYLIHLNLFQASIMAWSNYPNHFVVFIVGTLTLCGLIFFIAKWISHFRLSQIFVLIGRHSKIIMSYHLLTFLLLDLIFMPSDVVLKALFTPFKNTNMALVYVACGVLLPLMLGVFFDYVKKLAWFHYKKQN